MDERTPRVAEAQGTAPGRARLEGRRILVVGGGQASYGGEDEPTGNGRAITLLCAREGATVLIMDRDPDSAEETARLARAEGATAHTIIADATSEDDVKRVLAEANDLVGGLDGMVLNVGIERGHLFSGTTVEDWDAAFSVNVKAHFLFIKHGLPILDDGASLVQISSTGAFSSGIEVPSYSASKSALAGLCNHAAREGSARGIRCNIVAPGPQDTPLGRSGGRRRPSRAGIQVPIGRYGTAWDAAYAVLFLLSNESTFVTAQTLIADGGRMMR